MLSTERADFEAQLAVLFGGYPTFLTPPRIEAYWRGLAKMPLSLFVRTVDCALGEAGTDKLPTVNTLWQISKRLRAPVQGSKPTNEKPIGDDFLLLGNRWLLAFLLGKQGASAESLAALVSMKNRIVVQFRNSGDKCGGTETAEWLEVATGAFEKLWHPAAQSEIDAAMHRHTHGAMSA